MRLSSLELNIAIYFAKFLPLKTFDITTPKEVFLLIWPTSPKVSSKLHNTLIATLRSLGLATSFDYRCTTGRRKCRNPQRCGQLSAPKVYDKVFRHIPSPRHFHCLEKHETSRLASFSTK